jgi:transporter family protein
MNGLSAFGWALLASFCWGFAPLFEKVGLRGNIDPAVGVLIRTVGVLLGVLLIFPAMPKFTGRFADLTPRNWFFLSMGGLLASVIGQLCFYRALKLGEVSKVVPIGASYPVLAFLLGILFFRESVTLPKMAGIALVIAGVFLLR